MAELEAIYFVVGNSSRGIYSHTWRVWWHGTSFYVKARNKAMSQFKISMHGPDESHPNPGFIVGSEQSTPAARHSLVVDRGRFLGSRFSGKPMPDGGLLVLSFRFGAELFQDGMPSEHPTRVREGDRKAASFIPAPGPGELTDVHLFLTRQGMRIPAQEHAQEAGALLGPLVNKNEDILTGMAFRVPSGPNPGPEDLYADPSPTTEDDRVRGFGTTIGEDGRLWIVERWLSRKALMQEAITDSE